MLFRYIWSATVENGPGSGTAAFSRDTSGSRGNQASSILSIARKGSATALPLHLDHSWAFRVWGQVLRTVPRCSDIEFLALATARPRNRVVSV
jgi:hypothetical protein